jgi:serine protease
MARTAIWVKRAALAASALTLIGMAGCDRQEERLDRLGDLSDAVLGQLGGEDVSDNLREKFASVPVESRAFAGTILERAVAATDDEAAPRFIIGSIVAKPSELPAMVEMSAVMAQPERSLDMVVDDQAEAKIIILDQKTLDEAVLDPGVIRRIELPQSQQRSVTVVDPEIPWLARGRCHRSEPALPRAPLSETVTQKRVDRGLQQPVARSRMMAIELPATPEERMAQLPRLNPKVAQRAMIQPSAALQRQLAAEEKMIETATKFKVAASIQRSRSGQMVIEIGSDALNPTNFTEAVLQQGRIALENGVECDEIAAAAEDANPLVSMECVIQDLKASGEFEYVEKDWLVRAPDDPSPGPYGASADHPE